ncbi:MAG: MgtC/SapB family protein [Xanthobacteraceae bacterium]
MDFENLLTRVALSLGIGLLIGLERGWRRREAERGQRAAGIRTFAISGLLGGITGAVALSLDNATAVAGGLVLASGFAVHALVIAIFCREENKALGIYSATTMVAAMLTFALGAYALVGDVRVAAAGAVATAAILALREELHGWVETITWPELRSGLVLLAMTFIALPIVPAEPIGPFGGVNPREVWLIAIVLACVSFAGYAAVKYLGASRGVLVAAAAGGLVSSTAVTVANARRAAAGEGSARLLAAGVAVATAVMFMRVFVIAAALQPRLLMQIGAPLVAGALTAVGYALVATFGQTADERDRKTVKFRNPFGFWSVIGVAVLLALVIVLGRAVGESFGAQGAIVGAVVVGLVDVDSVTVAMSRLTPGTLTAAQAGYAILAAVASDTFSKIGIGALLGRGWFAVEIAMMAAFCLAIGTVVFLLLLAFPIPW